MGRKHTALLLGGAIVGAALLAAGCARENPAALGENLPPDTQLSVHRERSEATDVRVRLTWSGMDADGKVNRFLIRWDSLDWVSVTSRETLYVWPPEELASEPSEIPSHTFAVKAVDDEGAEDPSPAAVTLTPRNALPETQIITAPPAVTGPLAYLEWRGWDYDGIVAGYGWRLSRWDSGSSEWVVIDSRDSLPPEDVSATLSPLDGEMRFEVWAIDDEGGIDSTPALAEFTCLPDIDDPALLVRCNVLDTTVFQGAAWAPEDSVPVSIFGGEQLAFDWSAESLFGYDIVGYSSAWDDTSLWCDAFTMSDTHLDITPASGQHSLYVASKTSCGSVTRGRILFDVVQAGLNDYILVVDDYDLAETLPAWGTDEMRDAFYDTLTSGYSRPVLEWDCKEHLVAGRQQPPDVATLAGASTVVWYCDGGPAAISRAFDPDLSRYSPPAGYVRVGGNLVLDGYKIIGQIVQESYPITVAPSDTTRGRVFVRDGLNISFAKNSGSAQNKMSPWTYGYCFYGAVPTMTWVPGVRSDEFEPVYIDSVGPGGYPTPGKWPLYTSAQPALSRAGLPTVDAVAAYRGWWIETHVMDSFLNVNFEGQPCVLLSPTGVGRGNTCYVGFHLYYTETSQALAFFDRLLSLFGEEKL